MVKGSLINFEDSVVCSPKGGGSISPWPKTVVAYRLPLIFESQLAGIR